MALDTDYDDYKKISDVRLNKINTRRTLANTIERASTIVYTREIANSNAGDHSMGVAAFDMELIKAYVEFRGDEGTNGTVALEKWDDVGGSTQAAMTAAATVSAGAAAIVTLTPNSDRTEKMTAGEKLNIVTASIDGGVAAIVTLVFKLVDNVDNS